VFTEGNIKFKLKKIHRELQNMQNIPKPIVLNTTVKNETESTNTTSSTENAENAESTKTEDKKEDPKKESTDDL